MTGPAPIIVWFRQDLRLEDNPALSAAAATGAPVLPVFILDEVTPGVFAPGAAARWWLHHSLAALADRLARRGAPLVLRRGPVPAALMALVADSGARAVYWNRACEPCMRTQDRCVGAALAARGITAMSFPADLLFEPDAIRTRAGGPFKVFTRFWAACQAAPEPPPPQPAPARLLAPARLPASERLEDWGLCERGPEGSHRLRAAWQPGESQAKRRLALFLDTRLERYASARNRPDGDGTSRLSPHLHWGEIGPRQIWHAVRARARQDGVEPGAAAFLRELGWREFAHHLLFHFPDLGQTALDPRFATFPWRDDARALAAWQRGETGYPLVDAGMRQLRQTGWMHNRVRMVVGSFLVKHLLVPWQSGAAWFWDSLVDADLANNALGWQWVAGCGPDAAPYVRVFNPALQGERFDPEGIYVRHWVPELAGLPARFIHRPWTAPAHILAAAGVSLGRTYPHPIVDHAAARARALAAYGTIAGKTRQAPRARTERMSTGQTSGGHR